MLAGGRAIKNSVLKAYIAKKKPDPTHKISIGAIALGKKFKTVNKYVQQSMGIDASYFPSASSANFSIFFSGVSGSGPD